MRAKYLEDVPLGQQRDVGLRLAAHAQESLAPLHDLHAVRALEVAVGCPLAQADVEEAQVQTLAGAGAQRPAGIGGSGLMCVRDWVGLTLVCFSTI